MTDTCDIGAELVEARRDKVPWKVLEHKYGKSRRWLHEIYRTELDRRRGPMAAAVGQMQTVIASAQGAIKNLEIELEWIDGQIANPD